MGYIFKTIFLVMKNQKYDIDDPESISQFLKDEIVNRREEFLN